MPLVHRGPVGELDLRRAAGRTLRPEEHVVGGVVPGADRRVVGGVEHEVGHELEDLGDVDVHRAFEPGERTDQPRHLAEVGVLLETLGGQDVPEQRHHRLALGGDLGLGHRVEQQVAPVLWPRAAEVVDGAVAEQLHRDQPGVGVDEAGPHVRKVGDRVAVQDAVVGVGDRLVEGVLAHPDRAAAQVELAHVDGVQGGGERIGPGAQDVLLVHRVVGQPEIADVHLPVHDVAEQLVVPVAAVGNEPDVAVGPVDVGAAPEHRHHPRHVAVADVVLLAGGPEGDPFVVIGTGLLFARALIGAGLLFARALIGAGLLFARALIGTGREEHVGVVDVSAVLAFGQREGHHATGVELGGRLLLGLDVVALPDRAEPEDRDLLGVPVRQPVEAEYLAEDCVA